MFLAVNEYLLSVDLRKFANTSSNKLSKKYSEMLKVRIWDKVVCTSDGNEITRMPSTQAP